MNHKFDLLYHAQLCTYILFFVRYYMQLPLTEAHEYHTPDAAVAASSRYVHHHITKTYNLNSLHLQGKRYQCMPEISNVKVTNDTATYESQRYCRTEWISVYFYGWHRVAIYFCHAVISHQFQHLTIDLERHAYTEKLVNQWNHVVPSFPALIQTLKKMR